MCVTLLNKVYESIIKKNKATSLTLLNKNALNAAFNVAIRVVQKFIKKNEVKPINSQPKNNITKLPAIKSKTILITNKFKKINKRSTCGSYLKYENAYKYAKKAIVTVRRTKLKLSKST